MRRSAGICAILVLYHPDLAVVETLLAAIVEQVDRIVAVDNGRSLENAPGLEYMAREKSAHLIHCAHNIGVAAAHNLGIEWARANGCSHVLLLDQDSIPAPDMVKRLLGALASLLERGVRVAAVGPQYVDAYTGIASPFRRLGRFKPERVYCRASETDQLVETDFLIASGSLIPVDIFDEVGLMDPGLFIDHVDTDWVFRAKHSGFKVFGVCSAIMKHSLGSATLRFWFLRWRNAPLHSPERHYYSWRNSLVLSRRPYAPKPWILNDVAMRACTSVFYVLFATHRVRRIGLMAKGLWHGIRGVQGPLK